MKLIKCEMHKVALAALVLGVFSLSPTANALGLPSFMRYPAAAAPSAASTVGNPAPAPTAPAFAGDGGQADNGQSDLIAAPASGANGMSLNDLRNIGSGVSVNLVGDKLYMHGSIPRKCAMGASISVATTPGVDGKDGQHSIKFVPGDDCDKLSAADRKDLVQLSSPGLFGRNRALADSKVNGPVCMLHGEEGAETCDEIPDAKYVSKQSLQAALDLKNAQAKAKFEAEKRDNLERDFISQLQLACKNGDMVGFGAQIEAWKGFAGDVRSQLLGKVDDVKQKYLAAQITKAKDADSAKDAYQAYLDAAAISSWPADKVDKVTADYAAKRVTMVNDLVKDSSKSASERGRAVRELASDLRDMDLYDKEHKSQLGAAYIDLANSLKDSSDLDLSKMGEAEKYYGEALKYADAEQKVKIDVEIEKMYATAADQCLADVKESGKSAAIKNCQAIAAKAKKSMDAAIKAQSRIKNDGSLAALAAMKQEKIAKFGGGVSYTAVTGYDGTRLNVNMQGGSWDSSVYTTFAQTQQSFLQQMYQGGGQRSPSGDAGGGGSIF